MKKLLFVLCMVLSGHVVAATEYSFYYSNLQPLANAGYGVFHRGGCAPTVLSLESGHGLVAVWLAGIDAQIIGVTVMNISNAQQSGIAKIRLGACQ